MSRAWFYNIPMHGHINPTLPLVRELVRQGDEVTYYAGPRFEEKIRASGAEFGDYGGAYAFESSRTEAHAVLQGSQLAEATAALLPGVMAAVERERPDYLLFDMSAAWGNIVAQRYDVPAVASFPHLPFTWQSFLGDRRLLAKGFSSIRPGHGHFRELGRQMSRLARDHNLRRPSEINVLSSTAELNLVFSTRYFQPHQESLDDAYVFIGPVINTERPDEVWQIQREADQTLIYIAVGTLYQADVGFFRSCMDALADERFEVILSVGKAVDPSELGAVPDNFSVAQYVPQLAILDEADLFITHGGMNSINEAVMAGVPMVVVPNTIEQAANAARLEQLQGGLYLEPEAVTAETLREAVNKVLVDPGLQGGLGRIRESFLDASGVAGGVEAIQRFKTARGIG